MRKSAATKVTLESLAGMVVRGFDEQEKKISGKMTQEIAGVKSEIKGVETRLSQQITGINNRIDDLALNRATREELSVLDKWVLRIETKLGLDFKRPAHA